MNWRALFGIPTPSWDATQAGGAILRGLDSAPSRINRCAKCAHSFVQSAGASCHRCAPEQLAEVRRPSAWECRKIRLRLAPEIRRALRLLAARRDPKVAEFKRAEVRRVR